MFYIFTLILAIIFCIVFFKGLHYFLTVYNKRVEQKLLEITSVHEKNASYWHEEAEKTIEKINNDFEKRAIETTNKLLSFEKDRETKYTQLSTTLSSTNNTLKQVDNAVVNLGNALAGTKTRGNLGEKLLEEILGKLGFIEGTHFVRQSKNEQGTIPDITFILANGLKCNCDSKFPLTNYLKHIQNPSEAGFLEKFLKDVRDRVKELSNKGYISDETVDFVLVFLPNSSVFDFILENDPEILDFCMERKVILCSPITLYMVLRVFYQVNHLFNVEKNVKENILKIEKFNTVWAKYKEDYKKLGSTIDKVSEMYYSIDGLRTKNIDKSLTSFGS